MSKSTQLSLFILTSIVLTTSAANAQFGNLLQKAKDKALQKASDMMDKKSSDQHNGDTKKSSKLVINSAFDFVAGDSILFADNFSGSPDGSSTHAFKTNGSATVVSLKDEAGKWLSLQDNSTYKLSRQLFYPKHFTVEFNVIAVADKVDDIYPMIIGFTKDNSVSQFDGGDGAYVNLMYYNDNEIQVNSSYINKYLNTEFDLNTDLNRTMHVSIAVDGERMMVYLDNTKIADTQLFLPSSPKNFYISGPMMYKNGSKLLVSNFKISTFKRNL